MVFFFIYLAIWKTIYLSTNSTEINGYSLSNTITYYFATSIIFRLDVSSSIWLASDIWDGAIANDLVKPWNVKVIHFLVSLSQIGVDFLLFLPFCIFIFFIAHEYLIFPDLLNLLFFVITLILGFFLNMFFNLIFHSLTFHFGDQEANIELVNYIVGFLAGSVFPLVFLPELMKRLFYFLPFRFLFDTPANIFLGKLTFSEILSCWLQMGLWIAIFYLIFFFIFKSGLKKFTGTGK